LGEKFSGVGKEKLCQCTRKKKKNANVEKAKPELHIRQKIEGKGVSTYEHKELFHKWKK